MARIAPSYDEVLDALCKALSHVDRSTYHGGRAFFECEAVAARAGRDVKMPAIADTDEEA